MADIKFEIRKSTSLAQPYFWHIKSTKNHKILAASEAMVNKQDCIDAMKLIKSNADSAFIWDLTGDKPKIES